MKYRIGDEMFYHGDQANDAGWFIIIDAMDDEYGNRYKMQEIKSEQSQTRTFHSILEMAISEVYSGNRSTRIVTRAAKEDYDKNSFMFEKGEIKQDNLDDLRDTIKEEMSNWITAMKQYENSMFSDMDDVWG